MKTAVYGATRNLYYDMIPSIKSLAMHTDVDKVVLLIEDDNFPFFLPEFVETRNVSGQGYFTITSPNYENPWTYMILLRAVYSKMFPDCDRVVSLDCDTIILQDISELWDMDLGNNLYAAVEEHTEIAHEYTPDGPYFNVGVLVHNLKLIREEGVDELLKSDLETTRYHFNEQDCINRNCKGRILGLPSVYNDSFATERNPIDKIKIAHFAGTSQWQDNDLVDPHRLHRKYREVSWEEVLEYRDMIHGQRMGKFTHDC